MSTLKVNNLQVGQDGTAANNYTLYQPASPDGTVRLGYGVAGSVTDILTLKNSRLGIGTNDPQASLHAYNASGTTLLRTSVNANSTVGFEIVKTGSTTQSWRIVDGQTINGALEFYDVTDSTTRMIIRDGKVGIGTSNPTQKLVVKGTTSLMATNSTNQWMAYTYTDNTFRLNYNGAGADEITVLSSGEVGVGAFTPGAGDGILQIAGGLRVAGSASASDTTSPYIYRTSGYDHLNIATNGLERLRITNTGLVGINCTPLSQFQVKGGTNANIGLTVMSNEAAIEAFNDAGSSSVPLRLRGSELKFFIDGTQRARLYYSSNSAVLALGDESNSAGHIRLEAKASENQIHGRSNHPIAFLINTGEKLKLHTSGLLEGKGAQFTENVTPSSGRGVEIFEASAGVGLIQSFNRTGGSFDELRFRGSEVRLYSSTNLRLDIQNAQSYLYGTSDGILNLDTTDSRGTFIRYKENGSTKCWAGCSEGLGTGGNQDDFGIRATRHIRLRPGSATKVIITNAGHVAIGGQDPNTDFHVRNPDTYGKDTYATANTGGSQTPPPGTIEWENQTPVAGYGRGYRAWVQSGDAYPNASNYIDVLIRNSGFYRITLKRSHSSAEAAVCHMMIYGLANSSNSNYPVVHMTGASGSGTNHSTVQSGGGRGSSNAVASFYWEIHSYNVNTHDTIIRIHTTGSNNQGIVALIESI